MALLALALAACAPAQSPGSSTPAAGPCDAAALARMAGRVWSDTLRAEVLRLSGARTVRVIRPGDMVTMDFRGDRLNIRLTGHGSIERFACG